jgi:hypothetical protein
MPSQEQIASEDRLQILAASVGALLPGALYLALPEALAIHPNWLPLVAEAALVGPPLVSHLAFGRRLPYPLARGLALALLVVVTISLIGSLALLVVKLPDLRNAGSLLLRSGALLWGTNVLVFALWYWEVDGGGPLRRHQRRPIAYDFLFPQHIRSDSATWKPGFIDYVFLAFCFATALSPADTMPLTHRAKLLMMAQALISLLVLVLLVARSVNIL